jgi:hypothetical protein
VLDRIGTDHLTRQGTGLTVAVRTERLYSYETAPILYGAGGWATSHLFTAPVNALPGSAAGFTVSILARPIAQVSSYTRGLFGQREANPGWGMATLGANNSIVMTAGNAAAAVASSAAVVLPGDIGKLRLIQGYYDGVGVGLRDKRVAIGTPQATAFDVAATTAPMIGRYAHAGVAAVDGWEIYGITYALGVSTLAQYQAQWDLCMAYERIVAVPGLPGMVFDLDHAARAAGAAVAATLADRSGGAVTFSRTGTPTLAPLYARAWAA